MEPLRFVRSRGKIALMLVAAVFLIGMCLLMAIDPTNNFLYRAIGWFGTAFFGLASLVGLRNLVAGGTAFSLDSAGITDHTNRLTFPWNDIEECSVRWIRGTTFLGIAVRNREQFLSRLGLRKRIASRLDERMGCGQWALSFAEVSPNVDAALDFIREHAPSVRVREP